MSKIIKGLRSAVEYARGDTTKGKSRFVTVPKVTPDMTAEQETEIMNAVRAKMRRGGIGLPPITVEDTLRARRSRG